MRVTYNQLCKFLIYLLIAFCLCGSVGCAPQQKQQTIVSRVITNDSGKTYIEVDGVPFLYNSIQSWYPPEKNYDLYVQKAAEAGYKCFSFWLYWKDLEREQRQYDWSKLEEMVDLANKYDVRLDIVWAGTNFCDHIDPRFAPQWLLNGHDYHLKDQNGKCTIARGFDMGNCCAVDPKNKQILAMEKRLLIKLLEHLNSYDKTHRVIAIQIQNEPNINGYKGGKKNVLTYINTLGQAVKESDYVIITRVNLASKSMDPEVDALQYIDGHGPDTYNEAVEITRNIILNDPNNTKFRYIAENSAWCNSTSHIVAALSNGGFYNIYRLDFDQVWNKPGLYGRNLEPWMVTKEVTQLNSALNKIASLIAKAPKEKMLEFNTEYGYPTIWYDQKKTIANKVVGFKCRDGSEPVGLVVEKDGDFYCVADNIAYFVFSSEPKICETGRFNNKSTWQIEEKKSWTKLADGTYQISYNIGQCIRLCDQSD